MIVSISNTSGHYRCRGSDGDRAALRRRRRSWSLDEKRRIVDESLADGASIAKVARHYDLNANQLFTWRRQFGVEPVAPKEFAPILPVTIAPDTTAADSDLRSTGQIWRSYTSGEPKPYFKKSSFLGKTIVHQQTIAFSEIPLVGPNKSS